MARIIVTSSLCDPRRSTCGTIRSSVRKLTRYRPTSPAPGTVTTKIDSAPGRSVGGFDRDAAARQESAIAVEEEHDRGEPIHGRARWRIAHDAANGQSIAVAFVTERDELERQRRRRRSRRRLVRRVGRPVRSATQNDDDGRHAGEDEGTDGDHGRPSRSRMRPRRSRTGRRRVRRCRGAAARGRRPDRACRRARRRGYQRPAPRCAPPIGGARRRRCARRPGS